MDIEKVRSAEWLALAGGVITLIALLFMNWYSVGASIGTPLGAFAVQGEFGAWDGQGFTGTVANLVILAAGAAGIALMVLAGTARTVALPVTASALTAGLGIAAVAMVLLRMLFQPGPNEAVGLETGIWIALVGCALAAAGGWRAMADDGSVSYADRTPAAGAGTGPRPAEPEVKTGASSAELPPLSGPSAEPAPAPPSRAPRSPEEPSPEGPSPGTSGGPPPPSPA